jgi:uncharacterized protein YceK
MKPNILVTLIVAGTALLGGCASADSRDDCYDNDIARIENGRAIRY